MKIKSLFIGAMALMMSAFAFADGHVNLNGPGSLPADPEVGKCYVHKFYPPQYNAEEVKVLVKEEYTYYTKTDPVIGTDKIFFTFDVPDYYEIIDPVFEQENVQIMIKPDDPVW